MRRRIGWGGGEPRPPRGRTVLSGAAADSLAWRILGRLWTFARQGDCAPQRCGKDLDRIAQPMARGIIAGLRQRAVIAEPLDREAKAHGVRMAKRRARPVRRRLAGDAGECGQIARQRCWRVHVRQRRHRGQLGRQGGRVEGLRVRRPRRAPGSGGGGWLHIGGGAPHVLRRTYCRRDSSVSMLCRGPRDGVIPE